jgi:hypothetical protein
MTKHLHLTIAKPCHEDWNNMADVDKGKFCESCQKQVVDFTGMSDGQLAAFFKKPVSGSTCGRFHIDQLDKQIPIPKKRIPWVRYFFQFTLPLFLTTLKLNAQKRKTPAKTIQADKLSATNNNSDLIILGGYSGSIISLEQKVQIRGKVFNEEGRPIPFASIDKGQGGTVADSSGSFLIELVPDIKGAKLVVSCVGYEPKEVTLQSNQILSKEEILVILKGKELNPVTVTSGWRTISCNTVMGGLSIKYDSKRVPGKIKPVHFSSFKIYSNPVRANSSVFIKPEKTELGLYAIELLNLSGQSIKQEEAKFEIGMSVISFSIPSIPAGSYFVNLINKKTGKKYSEKLIVQ